MKETPEQFMEACRFANKSAPLHIGDNMPDPNTCGNEYAALTGSPYAPRFKEQAYVAEINQLLVRVAELEIQNLGLSEQAIKDRREAGELRARVAELEGQIGLVSDEELQERARLERRVEELRGYILAARTALSTNDSLGLKVALWAPILFILIH